MQSTPLSSLRSLIRALVAVLSTAALMVGCSSSNSSSPGSAATSLADSLSGKWHGHEVAYSGYTYGYGGSRDTLDFAATITKVNDSVISVSNNVKYWNLPWHFEGCQYTLHAGARTLGIPTTSVSGTLYSADSFVITGWSVGDSSTHWTGFYSRVN